jgi:hypothetical protein
MKSIKELLEEEHAARAAKAEAAARAAERVRAATPQPEQPAAQPRSAPHPQAGQVQPERPRLQQPPHMRAAAASPALSQAPEPVKPAAPQPKSLFGRLFGK